MKEDKASDYVQILVAIFELLGHIVWPAAVVFVVYYFRKDFQLLLNRVASLNIAGGIVVFQPEASSTPAPPPEEVTRQIKTDAVGFLELESIKNLINESQYTDKNEVALSELLIFSTLNQRTWLISTKSSLFIMLDDPNTRQSSKIIQNILDKQKILPVKILQDQCIIQFAADPAWWYYSNNLFSSPSDLKKRIENLVRTS